LIVPLFLFIKPGEVMKGIAPIKFSYKGTAFVFYDVTPESKTGVLVANEISRGSCEIKGFSSDNPYDVMIDIGANIGMISILFGKLYPNMTIYAIEPVPETFQTLVKNIQLNKVTNVHPVEKAITSDGRKLKMVIDFNDNPGGATSFIDDKVISRLTSPVYRDVQSMTLDDVFVKFNIKKCKLLKIDCEGCEYEVLMKARNLDKVEYLLGEFHETTVLKSQGNSVKNLLLFLKESYPQLKTKLNESYESVWRRPKQRRAPK
jgi:FkbM family methyltransferase